MPSFAPRLLPRFAPALALLVLAGRLAAQDSPPAYLQIFREEVKPGRSGPHVAAEAGWPRAFSKAGIKNHYFGMTTTYGPSEAWFVEGHASVAEIEDVNNAIEASAGLSPKLDLLSQADAANITSAQVLLTRYQPELSNGVAIDVSAMHVWEVIVFRVRPGHEADFIEAAKLYKSTVEQAKIDYPWATYSVLAGMRAPTFMVFVPHRYLSEIDPAMGANAALEKAFTEESMKRLSSLSGGYESVEDLVFTVNPRMSYLSPEFVARDPQFWAPKSVMPKEKAAPTKPTQ